MGPFRNRTRSTFLSRLVQTGGAVAAAAAVGSVATTPGSRWYQELALPSWQPPKAAFPIVWTGLFAGLALTSAAVLARHDMDAGSGSDSGDAQTERTAFQRALAVNLVLNAAWSVLFWRVRRPALAAVEAGMLAASTVDLARRAGRVDPRLGLSLLPYAAWGTFATYLTATIARLNPRRTEG